MNLYMLSFCYSVKSWDAISLYTKPGFVGHPGFTTFGTICGVLAVLVWHGIGNCHLMSYVDLCIVVCVFVFLFVCFLDVE